VVPKSLQVLVLFCESPCKSLPGLLRLGVGIGVNTDFAGVGVGVGVGVAGVGVGVGVGVSGVGVGVGVGTTGVGVGVGTAGVDIFKPFAKM